MTKAKTHLETGLNWPRPAGYYGLERAMDVRFTLTVKPSWFRRLMMRHLLGFRWVDLEDEVRGV